MARHYRTRHRNKFPPVQLQIANCNDTPRTTPCTRAMACCLSFSLSVKWEAPRSADDIHNSSFLCSAPPAIIPAICTHTHTYPCIDLNEGAPRSPPDPLLNHSGSEGTVKLTKNWQLLPEYSEACLREKGRVLAFYELNDSNWMLI